MEFKLSDGNEEVDVVKRASFRCHSGLHLTSILIYNRDSL
jgi:hypothetical protein